MSTRGCVLSDTDDRNFDFTWPKIGRWHLRHAGWRFGADLLSDLGEDPDSRVYSERAQRRSRVAFSPGYYRPRRASGDAI